MAVGFLFIGRIFEHSKMPVPDNLYYSKEEVEATKIKLTYHPDSCKFASIPEAPVIVEGRKFR